MKVTKDAVAAGRRLFRLCTAEGFLNEDKLRKVIKTLVDRKPRNYKGILVTLHRQARLAAAERHVTIESAKQLDEATANEVANKMKATHGEGLTFEYKIKPELIGGMRIRKGDDVWDGSVKNRLDRLSEAFKK